MMPSPTLRPCSPMQPHAAHLSMSMQSSFPHSPSLAAAHTAIAPAPHRQPQPRVAVIAIHRRPRWLRASGAGARPPASRPSPAASLRDLSAGAQPRRSCIGLCTEQTGACGS
eukprot:363566-Chlamydomonas_euryale.AAC.10